ncbi:IclR family transcriptional regulator [Pseudonocardia endophytica]|uniref:IclR family transcriptional regulator n=1 Tax=Pseudonocardia endophytica TaxID=401976 RepID=UPI0014042772|nr:IclR family transcriptional regulator [Pseudonocardia endophytica]
MTGASGRSASPAVTRAAAILTRLAAEPGRPVGPSELSRQVGVPKSTVLNVCAALVEAGLLSRSGEGYELGGRLAELGHAYLAGVTEVEVFHRLCRERYPQTSRTVQLAVLGDGASAVYLARHDGRDPLHLGLAAEIGRSVPAYCTASGKALLAALDESGLATRVPADGALEPATTASLSTVDGLRDDLRATRDRGYATEDGEIVDGLCCVGVAVRTPRRADGLVGLSFTSMRRAADDPASTAAELRELAGVFAARIGGGLAY